MMVVLNDLRTIMTVIAFITFLGIVFWAYSGRRKTAFDEAARIPLEEDELYEQGAAPEGLARVERSVK